MGHTYQQSLWVLSLKLVCFHHLLLVLLYTCEQKSTPKNDLNTYQRASSSSCSSSFSSLPLPVEMLLNKLQTHPNNLKVMEYQMFNLVYEYKWGVSELRVF